MSIQNSNFPIMSVTAATDLLSNAYISVINNGKSPKLLPSVMLWGPPGVGKSDAVRELGRRIARETKKSVKVTDVRLLLFNPIDLRGIPTANEEKTLAIWLKPKIFQMDEGDGTVNILFLDEISAAPQSVQAAAYQITLDRVVGEHKLPDNCIVIAAGNRVTDRSVATKMPKALANRLLHIEIEGSASSWLAWAVEHGINPKVVGFISARPDHLFGFSAERDELAFATPRTWEMVSRVLENVADDADAVFRLIAGLVGNGAATEFRTWCRMNLKIPSAADIFAGKTAAVPKETDLIYAVASAMTAYARDHKYDAVGIGNSLAYAKRLPPDFAMMLVKSYQGLDEDYEKFLLTLPEYAELAGKKGKWRNGRI